MRFGLFVWQVLPSGSLPRLSHAHKHRWTCLHVGSAQPSLSASDEQFAVTEMTPWHELDEPLG